VQSKQDILVTILDESLDLLVSDLEAVIAANGGAEWQLRRAIHAYVERLVENADLATVLLLEHRSLQPELRARHIRKRDKYESLWRGIIAQGVRMGVFRPVDEAVAAFALLGVMNWMITWYRPHGRYLPSQLADQFADLFLKGLLTAEELEPHARSA
jgi:AcrR family transcriptional regulator